MEELQLKPLQGNPRLPATWQSNINFSKTSKPRDLTCCYVNSHKLIFVNELLTNAVATFQVPPQRVKHVLSKASTADFSAGMFVGYLYFIYNKILFYSLL